MATAPLPDRRYRLSARVSSDRPQAVKPVLEELFSAAAVAREGDEWVVRASVPGADPKDLNRRLLSRLRKIEKRTRLRAQWTAQDGTVYSFFDYVLKRTSRP